MFRNYSPEQNQILTAFSNESREQLFPHLSLVNLPPDKTLYSAGQIMRYIYFPIDSIVSLLHVTAEGAAIEMSLVGYEGFVGMEVFMGRKNAASLALVQSPGFAYRLAAHRLREEFENTPDLRALLLRYTQASIAQTAQTAACTRHHSVDQQLCRWLLLFLDRVPSNRFTMTQNMIAKQLGVCRESVSVAAGKLQKLGVIEYTRGQVMVLDRPELEKRSCECYSVVKRETDRLHAFQTPPKVV